MIEDVICGRLYTTATHWCVNWDTSSIVDVVQVYCWLLVYRDTCYICTQGGIYCVTELDTFHYLLFRIFI